jgi:hypothetical protein
LKSFLNTFFSNKTLIFAVSVVFIAAGSLANSFFVIAPAAYLIALALAYSVGGKISNHGLNVAYNWSIKWAVFIVFLSLTGIYLNEAFVYAMFSFILINIVLNPMLFISQNKVSTNG